MASPMSAAEFKRYVQDQTGPVVVRTREPEKFEYIEAGTFACPDLVIPVCLHADTIPVDSSVLGAPVAELCLTCDEQLPLPWPEDIP